MDRRIICFLALSFLFSCSSTIDKPFVSNQEVEDFVNNIPLGRNSILKGDAYMKRIKDDLVVLFIDKEQDQTYLHFLGTDEPTIYDKGKMFKDVEWIRIPLNNFLIDQKSRQSIRLTGSKGINSKFVDEERILEVLKPNVTLLGSYVAYGYAHAIDNFDPLISSSESIEEVIEKIEEQKPK